MYSFLAGVLAEKSPTVITIDVGGIGFQLLVPLSTSQKLPEVGEKVKVLTHHVVREDAQLLFGFLSEEERALFKLLLGVSGIGPKSALTILSGLGIRELKKAIVQGSVLALTAIPGIGRKTAERLIIELREKIVIEGRLDPEGIPVILSKHEALAQDSLRALVSLGYSKQDAKAAIQKVLSQKGNDRLNAESLIRESLKQIQYV
ncbi:MAG: Holliday junction DNA helicase RuvA [Omnitrophica bacterium RIFCSPHIGHO2_02_FULL_46_11]|nr:MAG: Holliday junction DNA helicase RuvA [Omnitrophica bacterium RIFCSPHIGHO2_02_FULL_46_11]OGW87812.1 MAG: Holliday junction DNA helicase RuvA [Omnitrophica bacterium RIFCSPLOWO2_01_FULL_45_10b]